MYIDIFLHSSHIILHNVHAYFDYIHLFRITETVIEEGISNEPESLQSILEVRILSYAYACICVKNVCVLYIAQLFGCWLYVEYIQHS